MQELAQEGLQPGVRDLGQALPLLYRRPRAFCRQQRSDTGVPPEEPHWGFNWVLSGQSVGW